MKLNWNKNQSLEALYSAFASAKTNNEARAFLLDLCSPTELQAMADRWSVVDFLKKGKSYREISEVTGVSVTTIGRVARVIEMGEGGYNLLYEKNLDPTVKP